MISVFFNNFTNLVHVYDELDLRKVFEYKDNSFLNDFTDYQLFYISKDKACVFGNECKCNVDWLDRFEQATPIEGKLYLWFMTNKFCFSPLKNIDEAKISHQIKQDTHIFVGGSVDGGDIHYTYEEFFVKLIKLYTSKPEGGDTSKLYNSLSELKEMLFAISGKVDSIIESSNKDEDNMEVISLKEELSKYRNDFYFKSVQRQGLDAMLEVLESMNTLLYNSRTKGVEVTEAIEHGIYLIERALQKTFKIRFESSNEGNEYDEEKMIAYPSDSIFTNDERLSGHVAKSLSPAIYWTIPRVNSTDLEFLYKEESVILYM